MNKQAFAVCSFFTVTVIKRPAFFAFAPFEKIGFPVRARA
jgi:hypothetical protein